MTLEKLINGLKKVKEQMGGECEVKVMQGDNELGFTVRGMTVLDEESDTGVTTEVVIAVDE